MGSNGFTFWETHKPCLAMLFTQFVYAGMALFSKAAISGGMNPFVFVVYRQVMATVVLAPFAFLLQRKNAPPLPYSLLCKIFFISLCGITLSLNLYHVAISYITATFAATTTNAIPVITFILAALMRVESISMKNLYGVAKVLGSVVCISGAFMVALLKGPPVKILNWHSEIHKEESNSFDVRNASKGEWVKGSLLMFAANTTWSMWLILQGYILQKYPLKLQVTVLQCFFSSIQSAVVAVAFERKPSSWKLRWDVHLVAVTYCGVIVTGISYFLQVWCIEKKGPVFTAMFTPLALLVTAVFSAFFWKETMHWGSVCGAILLVAGLYSVLWGKNKEESARRIKEQSEQTTLECITTN